MPSRTDQLGPVLIREPGFSLRWHSLPSLDELPVAEQIFYAIARGDGPALHALVQSAQAPDLERLLNITQHERLAGYLLSQLQLDASQDIADLAEILRVQAQVEEELFRQQSQQLTHVTSLLNEVTAESLFIKGPAVGRTVYATPQHRLSGDLDIVVASQQLAAICHKLELNGFVRDLPDCAQLGVGPCQDPASLLIQPNNMFVACDALTYISDECRVELKLDPVELGLRVDVARMLNCAVEKTVNGRSFLVPAAADQLLIALCHYYRDGFSGFRTELDIYLLAKSLTSTEWNEFCRTCAAESFKLIAYVGLALSNAKFNLVVPDFVLHQLRSGPELLLSAISFSLTPRFLWNQSSLPMLLLNAFFLGGTGKKLGALWSCLMPTKEFLVAYYCAERATRVPAAFLWWVNLFLLLMPSGITRRLIGEKFWPVSTRMALQPYLQNAEREKARRSN